MDEEKAAVKPLDVLIAEMEERKRELREVNRANAAWLDEIEAMLSDSLNVVNNNGHSAD